MALPAGVGSQLNKGWSIAKANLPRVGMVGFGIFDWQSRVRQQVQEGKGPGRAMLSSAFWVLPTMLMPGTVGGVAAAMLWSSVPQLPAMGAAAYQYFSETRSMPIRKSTPFSQRYEHSDNSYALQQRSLQIMGAAQGVLGSEAYTQHRRYGIGSRS